MRTSLFTAVSWKPIG